MPEVRSQQARIRFDDVGLGDPALLLKLSARSHFPTLEVPDEVAPHVEGFLSAIVARGEGYDRAAPPSAAP